MSDESQQTPSEAKRDTTSPDLEHHSGAVERARADLAAGRAWKARDRLTGHLADSQDPEALELLGEVHYGMGDLPAAGAAWFGTGRRGRTWMRPSRRGGSGTRTTSTRCGAACPAPCATHHPATRGSRRCAGAPEPTAPPAPPAASTPVETGGGVDPAVVITVVLAVLFVVCAVIGAITLLRWIIPGEWAGPGHG